MVLYSFGLALALAFSAPWWLWRMAASGRYRAGLRGRLGVLPAALDGAIAARGAAPGLIWLHAVSVGEVLAAERLVAELRATLPGHLVVVSSTTAAGYKVAGEKLGVPVFYFPLDFAFAVRRYLRALRPSLFVTMESELWPRVLVECERAGVPVAVVNARVSDRSFPRSMRLRRLWQPLLAKVTVFLAQGEETAERLLAIGVAADKVRVIGNLKFDSPNPVANALVERLRPMLQGKHVFVAGSTLEGEEKLLLEAWPAVLAASPCSVLILAPRHPQRFFEVGTMVGELQYSATAATLLDSEGIVSIEPGEIFLLNTLGDLASIYELATVAFLGGSLVQKGGHNPLEAARFGVPVVMGPSFENFRESVEGLRRAEAVLITDAEGLAGALNHARENSALLGERGRRFYQAQAGATSRTVDALLELIR